MKTKNCWKKHPRSVRGTVRLPERFWGLNRARVCLYLVAGRFWALLSPQVSRKGHCPSLRCGAGADTEITSSGLDLGTSVTKGTFRRLKLKSPKNFHFTGASPGLEPKPISQQSPAPAAVCSLNLPTVQAVMSSGISQRSTLWCCEGSQDAVRDEHWL